jgi:hypothetical protein
MAEEPNNQDPLFDTSSMAARNLEDPSTVVNRSIDPVEVAKPVEEPAASLGELGIKGMQEEVDNDIGRTAELSGMTYAIAKGKKLPPLKDSVQRATAAGKTSKKPTGRDIPASRLSTREKMIRDEAPPHIRRQMGRG